MAGPEGRECGDGSWAGMVAGGGRPACGGRGVRDVVGGGGGLRGAMVGGVGWSRVGEGLSVGMVPGLEGAREPRQACPVTRYALRCR